MELCCFIEDEDKQEEERSRSQQEVSSQALPTRAPHSEMDAKLADFFKVLCLYCPFDFFYFPFCTPWRACMMLKYAW